MGVYLPASKDAHPLNAPCPDCRCPKWLHTAQKCLTLRVVGGSVYRPKLQQCRCPRRAKDFAS